MRKPEVCCEAITESGELCRMPRLKDSAYCFTHDPRRRAERIEARRRGGRRTARVREQSSSSEAAPLETVDDVRRLLSLAAGDVRAMPPSIARARTAAYVAGAALKLLELSTMEQRIRELEQRLSEREGWR
jgi:hypothetical protein